MKALLSVILLLTIQVSFAQDEHVPTATVRGTITDFDKNIKVGEVIVFESRSAGTVYEVTSDDNGMFNLGLPYGDTYLIKIKGFTEDMDYSEMTIPALEPDQSGMTFQVDIQFEPGKEFTLRNVFFDSGKATITSNSYEELNNLVDFMKTRKNEIIEIGGHTDNVGDDNANMILSQRRAEAIKKYLVDHGVEGHRVKAKGYGEEFPVATNETKEGRAMNRRTEVKILTDTGKN